MRCSANQYLPPIPIKSLGEERPKEIDDNKDSSTTQLYKWDDPAWRLQFDTIRKTKPPPNLRGDTLQRASS